MKICEFCKTKNSNIKINLHDYCKECFINSTKVKIIKMIRACHPKTKILVYLKDSVSSYMFIEIFNEAVIKKKLKCDVEIIIPNDFDISKYNFRIKKYNEISGYSENILEYNIPDYVIEYAKLQSIDIIYFQNVVELIAVYSLRTLCDNSETTLKFLTNSKIDGMLIINPFEEIRMKSVLYYCHIKNIKGKRDGGYFREEDKLIYNFINEMINVNDLVVYSILNSLRKIKKEH
ncbi:hypothetical protein A0H76_2610 [Hepatospora eriocheir]|uniref:Cytoplasmic tRNA 2-thiolation protein 2 n=1 Tax=Hepatospora eriocheir TaxID=1081669 RepID=A0A1X0QJM1_9MICR|nr:hypothetical protein A0H76_2610 [Hepatospora eriocheir]